MSGRRHAAAAAVLLGAVLSGCAPSSSTSPEPEPVVGASAAPTTPAVDAEPSRCGLDATADQGTLSAAPESTWVPLGATLTPTSEQAGPGIVDDDGLPSCFARTPEGALFAAANVLAAGMVPELVLPVTDRLTATGPGRDAALADLEGRVLDPTSAYRVTFDAFELVQYTGTGATVDVVLGVSNGATLAQMVDLVWQDGDWKVQVTDAGEMRTPLSKVTTLSGHVPWGPTDE